VVNDSHSSNVYEIKTKRSVFLIFRLILIIIEIASGIVNNTLVLSTF
jgi:hypothetical protein